jgi:hypothetical protein
MSVVCNNIFACVLDYVYLVYCVQNIKHLFIVYMQLSAIFIGDVNLYDHEDRRRHAQSEARDSHYLEL